MGIQETINLLSAFLIEFGLPTVIMFSVVFLSWKGVGFMDRRAIALEGQTTAWSDHAKADNKQQTKLIDAVAAMANHVGSFTSGIEKQNESFKSLTEELKKEREQAFNFMKAIGIVTNETKESIGEISEKIDEASSEVNSSIGQITKGLQTVVIAVTGVSEKISSLESTIQKNKDSSDEKVVFQMEQAKASLENIEKLLIDALNTKEEKKSNEEQSDPIAPVVLPSSSANAESVGDSTRQPPVDRASSGNDDNESTTKPAAKPATGSTDPVGNGNE